MRQFTNEDQQSIDMMLGLMRAAYPDASTLTSGQVSRVLGCSVPVVLRMAKDRSLPAFQMVGQRGGEPWKFLTHRPDGWEPGSLPETTATAAE